MSPIDVSIVPSWNWPEWLSLGSIVGTFIIAAVAIVTLWKAHRERRRDRAESRRLEVLNWAEGINTFALRRRTDAAERQIADDARGFLETQLGDLFEYLEPFRSRSVYIAEIAPALGKDIKETVDFLIEDLRTQIRNLHGYRCGKDTLAEDAEALALAQETADNNSTIHADAMLLIGAIARSNVEDLLPDKTARQDDKKAPGP